MKQTHIPFLVAIAILLGCNTDQPKEANGENPSAASSAVDASISLPAGFKAVVFAERLGQGGRHIAVNANGDVYVQMHTLNGGKGIAALRDTNGDGKADTAEYFGSHSGTGMEIKGNFLYCSSDEAIFRYDLDPKSLVPEESSKVMLVGGFPQQVEHASKSIALDNEGGIYVNIGAPSNCCQVDNRSPGSPGQDPCPLLDNHAGIWKFDANKLAQQAKDGKRYASGIRNAVGLNWNESTNKLYIMQHGRDQLSEFWPKLYTSDQNADLPAEEFFEINEGDFCGWPYCYFDPAQSKKVLCPEYGGDGKKTGRCESAKSPLIGFPAHMAPNDVLFYNGNMFPENYKEGAFIAFHGSWNRSPQEQKGYFVAFVPFKSGKIAGDWTIFADGFAGVNPIPSPGDAKHRPCGLAIGPDGALYVSDSVEGRIWKIVYEKNQ